MLQLGIAGGASIGGSMYVLRSGDSALVIDAGAYPRPFKKVREATRQMFDARPLKCRRVAGRDIPILPEMNFDFQTADYLPPEMEKMLPDLRCLHGIKEIYILITHAHQDHIGVLPYVATRYPVKKIFMSEATLGICRWAWMDYLGLAKRYDGKALYSYTDINRTAELVQFIGAGRETSAGPFDMKFFRAGHILGALSPLIKAEGVGIFATGDASTANQLTCPGGNFLREVNPEEVDYVLSESTYAGKNSRWNREAAEAAFVRAVLATLRGGGKVLLPALAIGRSQELLAILKKHGVDKEFPIWLDGSAKDIGRIYLRHGMVSADTPEHYVRDKYHRGEILHAEEPCVVIAPAGMMVGGHALAYAKEWISDSKNSIFLTCYQHPSTPGYYLLNKVRPGQRIWLGEGEWRQKFTVRASVRQFHLSAHLADGDIEDTFRRFNPKAMFMVHGDRRGMNSLQLRLGERVVPTRVGNVFDLN